MRKIEEMKLNISNKNLVKIVIKGKDLITIDSSDHYEVYDANGIENLNCSRNQLTQLPILPEGLKFLICRENRLTFLPKLPESLVFLQCNVNKISDLPRLPNKLEYLEVSENELTRLPELPESLKLLYCAYNQISILPKLPIFLAELGCDGNGLTRLPELPESLKFLYCVNNPLKYVQFLKRKPVRSILPEPLTGKHSDENYERNYVLQNITRHLFLFFFRQTKNFNSVEIFSSVLSECVL